MKINNFKKISLLPKGGVGVGNAANSGASELTHPSPSLREGKSFVIFLGIAILTQFTIIFIFSLMRLYGNKTALMDTGVFYQVLWNFNQTGFPGSSINYPFKYTNFLGFHFLPIILLLAPLVKFGLWALFFVQSLAIASCGIPIFLCVSKILNDQKPALLWTLVFLFNPFVLNGAVFDFHEQCLALPVFCWAYYFVLKGDFWKLCLMCFLLLLFKEHYGIAVFGFGLLWWRVSGEKRGLLLAFDGLAAFILIVFVVMPILNNSEHLMLRADSQISRYGWIMKGDFQAFDFLFFHISQYTSVGYVLILLSIFLFLPLGGAVWLLPGLADFMVNMLSYISMPRSVFSYHSITMMPCLVIASVMTMAKILPVSRKVCVGLTVIILILALIPDFLKGPLAAPGRNMWNVSLWDLKDFKIPAEVAEIKKIIGDDSKISIQSNIGSWFAGRKFIYQFPMYYDGVDYVVLNADYPYQQNREVFGNPYNMANYKQALGDLKSDANFVLIYDKNNWQVYKAD